MPGQHAAVQPRQRPSAERRLAAVAAAAALLLIGIAIHLAAVVLAMAALVMRATGDWHYPCPRSTGVLVRRPHSAHDPS